MGTIAMQRAHRACPACADCLSHDTPDQYRDRFRVARGETHGGPTLSSRPVRPTKLQRGLILACDGGECPEVDQFYTIRSADRRAGSRRRGAARWCLAAAALALAGLVAAPCAAQQGGRGSPEAQAGTKAAD